MTTASPPKLRPLSIGELLDQAIRLYRQNFLKFIGIIAVVQIPMTLIQILYTMSVLRSVYDEPYSDASSSIVTLLLSLLISILNVILVQGLATAALTRAVSDNYLGESISFIEAYRRIGRSWLSLLGALLLSIIVAILLVIWFLIPCIGWITGVGILFFFSTVIVPLIAPVIVLEQQPASQSIRRAWDLARQRFWSVIGFVIVLYLFNLLVVSGPTMLFNLVADFSVEEFLGAADLDTYILQYAVQSLVTLLFTLLYMPLQLASMTLLYFDLRVRIEGFDLAFVAEQALSEGADVADIIAQAPQSQTPSLVTGGELGNFALLSILIAAMSFVLGLLGIATVGGAGGFI